MSLSPLILSSSILNDVIKPFIKDIISKLINKDFIITNEYKRQIVETIPKITNIFTNPELNKQVIEHMKDYVMECISEEIRSFEETNFFDTIKHYLQVVIIRIHLICSIAEIKLSYEEIIDTLFQNYLYRPEMKDLFLEHIYQQLKEGNMSPNFVDYLYVLFTYNQNLMNDIIDYIIRINNFDGLDISSYVQSIISIRTELNIVYQYNEIRKFNFVNDEHEETKESDQNDFFNCFGIENIKNVPSRVITYFDKFNDQVNRTKIKDIETNINVHPFINRFEETIYYVLDNKETYPLVISYEKLYQEDFRNKFISIIEKEFNSMISELDNIKKGSIEFVPILATFINFMSRIKYFIDNIDIETTFMNRLGDVFRNKNIEKRFNQYIDYHLVKNEELDSVTIGFILSFCNSDKFLYGYQDYLEKRIIERHSIDIERENRFQQDIKQFNRLKTIEKFMSFIADYNNGIQLNEHLILSNNQYRTEMNRVDLSNILDDELKMRIDEIISQYIQLHTNRVLRINYEHSRVDIRFKTNKIYHLNVSMLQYMILRYLNPEFNFVIEDYKIVGQWSFNSSSTTCGICRNELTETSIDEQSNGNYTNTTILTGICSHSFHHDCIMKWTKQHNNCPLCNNHWDIESVDVISDELHIVSEQKQVEEQSSRSSVSIVQINNYELLFQTLNIPKHISVSHLNSLIKIGLVTVEESDEEDEEAKGDSETETKNRIVNLNDRFSFKGSKLRTKIIKSKEQVDKDELKEREIIKEQRKKIIESLIVRTMKSRHLMNFNDLMTEIRTRIDFDFDTRDIRGIIEYLIERDYMRRTDIQNQFEYVP